MQILIAGGSGFIGTRLIERLLQSNHTITVLARNPSRAALKLPASVQIVSWDGVHQGAWSGHVGSADGIINLAGESIGSGRWTEIRKKKLMESRVHATQAIVDAIASSNRKPSVLVSASAVGYYGDVPEGNVTEDRPPGDDLLAQICVAWEQTARQAEGYGVRVAMPRTGIVLDPSEGALAKLLIPFRLFVGGPLGSGRQWFPWVHIEDEVGAIIHAVETASLSGPFNVSAPEYVTMKEFCAAMGRTMKRPSWAPVPGFVLKILLGEMAGPLLLSGQRAVSDKLQRSGFSFVYPRVRQALEDLLA